MNVELYNQKREELVALLAKSISEVGEIIGTYTDLDLRELLELREELVKAHAQAYDNIFKILLVAKFQGGKSTSFNAMSDGLCCSPMGNGAIKCSAAPMTIMNVDDDGKLGSTIRMRTMKELSALLRDAGIDCNLEKADIKDARVAWKARYEDWENNRRAWKDDDRDLLFVAGLIITHLSSPDVQRLLKKKVFDVPFTELGRFAKFPENYRSRYGEKGPLAFQPKEVLFPFVNSIECRVHSDSLRKVGAIVEDCPGLFASSYDTAVTLVEMSNASAVWYLLNAQMPGKVELDAIKTCVSATQNGRIFFSANVKDNRIPMPAFCKEILPQITQELFDAGIKNVTIRPYHAFGALTATLCDFYLSNGTLPSESSKDYLLAYSNEQGLNTQDPALILSDMAEYCMQLMYPRSRPTDWTNLSEKLSTKGVEILKRESNWDGVVEEIKRFVISTKAKSVLITDTSEKALKLVTQLMALLAKRESEASEALDAIKKKYAEAAEKLDKFVLFAKEKVDDALDGSAGKGIDKSIAADFCKSVFTGSVDEIADQASSPILEVSGSFRVLGQTLAKWTKNSLKWLKSKWNGETFTPNESGYALECRKILNGVLSSVCGENAVFWANKLKAGENGVFNQAVSNPAALVLEVIRREWDNTCKKVDVLKGLEPINLPPDPEPKGRSGLIKIDITKILEKMAWADFAKDLVAYVLGGLLFGFFGFDPITILIAALIAVIRTLATDEDELKMKISQEIRDSLVKSFASDEFNRFVESELIEKVAPLRQQVVNMIMEPIRKAKVKFKRERDIALADANKAQEIRDHIAEECKEIREKISNKKNNCLKKRLEIYIKDTEPLC